MDHEAIEALTRGVVRALRAIAAPVFEYLLVPRIRTFFVSATTVWGRGLWTVDPMGAGAAFQPPFLSRKGESDL